MSENLPSSTNCWARTAVIVSDIAGTTRDAIDTTDPAQRQRIYFHRYRRTAKKNKIKEELERYSIIRTVTAVERADVVVLVIDANEGSLSRMPRLPVSPMSEARA